MLCARVGIMGAGQMYAIGTQARIREIYSKSFEIKLQTNSVQSASILYANLERYFGRVLVSAKNGCHISFEISNDYQTNGGVSLADLFVILEGMKVNQGVAFYEVSHTSLDQLFIQIINAHGSGKREQS